MIGWLASQFLATKGRTTLIENIAVSIFGAFIGGDFIASSFADPGANASAFTFQALVISVVSALVMLALLALMRKAVGPMISTKPTKRKDY